jgi:hypothetical protein
MALTLSSSLLFTASLLVAACALFWPQLETLYLNSQHAAVNRTGSAGTKCPLVRVLLAHPAADVFCAGMPTLFSIHRTTSRVCVQISLFSSLSPGIKQWQQLHR